MPLILPNSVYFHIPKTGGTWVSSALMASGLASMTVGAKHFIPSQTPEAIKGRRTFAFVRHPIWWYRSMWSFMMSDSLVNRFRQATVQREQDGPSFFSINMVAEFPKFLENVIRNTPGYLSSFYELYLDNPKIEFIGRTETLVDDLVFILKQIGERFDENSLRKTTMRNCSQLKPDYPADLMAEIARLEAPAMKRFGYLPDGGVIPREVIVNT